ncbi:sensor histidine kinase [Paraburkholderia aspalathi]
MDVDDKGFVINVTAQPEHLQFTADRDLLHLIARNLLENALAHGRSRVIVGARLDETRQMILEVEDDGPGIAAEDRERVFEPFVRLAPGGEEGSGFGLGLALVRRAVYLQGGSIGISTSALGGACFRVTLPLPA